MPFPLFHALVENMHMRKKGKKDAEKHMVLSMLPDFFGIINISLWDKMHDKERIKNHVDKFGENPAIRAMITHLRVDDIFDSHVYNEGGMLYKHKEEIEKELNSEFGLKGKGNDDVTELIIELSFDMIAADKYDLLPLFADCQKNIDLDETAGYLKRFLGKSKRKIKKNIRELKDIEPTDLISVEGIIKLGKKRYLSVSNFMKFHKKIKSDSLKGFLSNMRFVKRIVSDKMHREKLKVMVESHKNKMQDKFDEMLNEVHTNLQRY